LHLGGSSVLLYLIDDARSNKNQIIRLIKSSMAWMKHAVCSMFEIHPPPKKPFRQKPLRIRNIGDRGVTGKHASGW